MEMRWVKEWERDGEGEGNADGEVFDIATNTFLLDLLFKKRIEIGTCRRRIYESNDTFTKIYLTDCINLKIAWVLGVDSCLDECGCDAMIGFDVRRSRRCLACFICCLLNTLSAMSLIP